MIGRRELFAATIVTVGAIGSSAANACSLTIPRKPASFRDAYCEQRIRSFVAFANIAHVKSDEEVDKWEEQTGISPAYEGDFDETVKTLRLGDGKVDPKPIKIVELELIRQLKNRASYAFVLKRHRYFAADEEGCNGLFTHGEYFGEETTAYLATFENNEFRTFREFPDWYI